jgi:hypothetical protein
MAVFVFVLGPLFESGSRGAFDIRVNFNFNFDCENFQRTLNSNKCECNLCPHAIRPMTRKSPRKLDHPLTSPQPSASEIYQAQLLLARVEANMAQKGKKKKAAPQ